MTHAPAARPGIAAPAGKPIVVGVADMHTSGDPTAEIMTFSLGSCLGVCVYDPLRKVGGLLHLMLPDSTINPERAAAKPHMFVDTGVPQLFHAVYALGGEKQRLVVKVAGGAQFLDAQKIFNIGKRNIDALGVMLSRNGVNVAAHDVGGITSRTMRLHLATGRVSIQTPGHHTYDL